MDREIKFRGDPKGEPEDELDLEAECKEELEELSEANKAISDRCKVAKGEIKSRTETGYYFNVCFKTKEDRDSFFTAIGMAECFFVDGYELADKAKIKISDTQPSFGNYRKDPRWLDLL